MQLLDDAKEHAIGRFRDMWKVRVRFGGRKVGAAHSERTGLCAKWVLIALVARHASTTSLAELAARMIASSSQPNGTFLTLTSLTKWAQQMKGLHDPQLLAALLRPFGPQPDAIRPSNAHPCPCVAASASLIRSGLA